MLDQSNLERQERRRLDSLSPRTFSRAVHTPMLTEERTEPLLHVRPIFYIVLL